MHSSSSKVEEFTKFKINFGKTYLPFELITMYLSNKFFETIRLFDKARSFYLTAQLNDSMGLRVATVNKMKYKPE